jgi:hypothetical protein
MTVIASKDVSGFDGDEYLNLAAYCFKLHELSLHTSNGGRMAQNVTVPVELAERYANAILEVCAAARAEATIRQAAGEGA